MSDPAGYLAFSGKFCISGVRKPEFSRCKWKETKNKTKTGMPVGKGNENERGDEDFLVGDELDGHLRCGFAAESCI